MYDLVIKDPELELRKLLLSLGSGEHGQIS